MSDPSILYLRGRRIPVGTEIGVSDDMRRIRVMYRLDDRYAYPIRALVLSLVSPLCIALALYALVSGAPVRDSCYPLPRMREVNNTMIAALVTCGIAALAAMATHWWWHAFSVRSMRANFNRERHAAYMAEIAHWLFLPPWYNAATIIAAMATCGVVVYVAVLVAHVSTVTGCEFVHKGAVYVLLAAAALAEGAFCVEHGMIVYEYYTTTRTLGG